MFTGKLTQRPGLKYDRTMPWRGERILDAKLQFVLTTSEYHVDDILRMSGMHGMITDIMGTASRNLESEPIPLQWTLSEALQKLASAPPHVRNLVMGIVPSRKGYSMRIRPADRRTVVEAINPEKAEMLGATLGMTKRTLWELQGAPPYARKAELIQTLTTSAGKWTGWMAEPRKPVTPLNGRPRTWLIDAAVPPPQTKLFTQDGDIMVIVRKIEKPDQSSKVAAFARIGKTDAPHAKDLFSNDRDNGMDDLDLDDSNHFPHLPGTEGSANVDNAAYGRDDNMDQDSAEGPTSGTPVSASRIWVTPKYCSPAAPPIHPSTVAPHPLPAPVQNQDARDTLIEQMTKTIEDLRQDNRTKDEQMRQLQATLNQVQATLMAIQTAQQQQQMQMQIAQSMTGTMPPHQGAVH